MPETKSRVVFRNASARHFYLKRRPTQPASAANFVLAPGETVEALDEQEELLLASMSDFRDVAKETPAIANQMDGLKKQLEDARAENEKLRSDKAELEKQVSTVKTQATGRSSRK